MDDQQASQILLPIYIRRSYTAMAFFGVVGEVLSLLLYFAVLVSAFILYQMTSSLIPSLILVAAVPLMVSVMKVIFYTYGILHWMEVSYIIEKDLIKVKKGEHIDEYPIARLDIDARQSYLGKLLGYGSLILIMPPSQNVELQYIAHPFRYESIIKEIKKLQIR